MTPPDRRVGLRCMPRDILRAPPPVTDSRRFMKIPEIGTAVVLKWVDRIAPGNSQLRRAAEALLEHFGDVWRASGSASHSERYATLYAAVDAQIAAVKKPIQARIPCVQGCNHCCKFNEILVSKWQAVAVIREIERLPAQERAAVINRIVQSQGHSGGGGASPCALLSEAGGCSVYGGRPLPCRGYHSMSEPDCRRRLSGEGGDPPTFVVLRIIELAALDVLSAAEAEHERAPMEINSLLRRIYSDPSRLALWAEGRPTDEPDLAAWPRGAGS
jgi:hypothetical protein